MCPTLHLSKQRATVLTAVRQDSGGGRFVSKGAKEFMVTKTSAERIGHLVRDIDHIPLRADHRGLVRFEHSEDPGYISVIEKLKGMAEKAPQALKLRAGSGYFGGEIQASKLSSLRLKTSSIYAFRSHVHLVRIER